MTIALYRIDDRLIHGQVVVGWGQPMNCGFIALVDDEVRESEWEQELYRMGVPPNIEVLFVGVDEARARLNQWEADSRVGFVLTADIETMAALADGAPPPGLRRVNVGGIHHRAGRSERLRYVYLSEAEVARLKEMAARGVEITAQDVPGARPVPLADFA